MVSEVVHQSEDVTDLGRVRDFDRLDECDGGSESLCDGSEEGTVMEHGEHLQPG